MKLLLMAFRRSRFLVLLALLFGLLSGTANAAVVAVAHMALERTSPGGGPAIAFVILSVALLAANALSLGIMARLPQQTLHELSMHLAEQVLETPLAQLERLGKGRLLSLLTRDVIVTLQGILMLPNLFVIVVMVAGSMAYLCWLSFPLFLWLAGFLVLGFAGNVLVRQRAVRSMAKAHIHQDKLFAAYGNLLDGLKELKGNNDRRQLFLRTLQSASQDFCAQQSAATSQFSVANTASKLIMQVLLGFIVFLSPHLVSNVGPHIQVGVTFTFFFVTGQLHNLSLMLPQLSQTSAALQRIESLQLALPAMRGARAKSALVKHDYETLELRQVSHWYQHERDGSRFELGPIDLSLRPGQLVFVVGGNGSGKSTLAKVLIGLYAPEAGDILLDGQAIDEGSREDYRQLFSTVFSDFHLFDFLPPSFDLERARKYLAELQLDHKVQINDGVLSTLQLSHGQRKRLALLTAYLEDRPIYVFDEWAADQDPVFKDLFYTRILPELRERGKLLFVITHDDRYFHLADRLVKLENGKIVVDQPGLASASGSAA